MYMSFVDGALPDGGDLESDREMVVRCDNPALRVVGVLDRDDSPGEDGRELFEFFERRTGRHTRAGVNRTGC